MFWGGLYKGLNKIQTQSLMSIETKIEKPAKNPIFTQYPGDLKTNRKRIHFQNLPLVQPENGPPTKLRPLFHVGNSLYMKSP